MLDRISPARPLRRCQSGRRPIEIAAEIEFCAPVVTRFFEGAV
jgi:hypothetical protein